MKRLVLICVAFGLLASPASAVTLVNPDGSRAEPYQTWADRARVPTIAWTLVVRLADTAAQMATLCRAPEGSGVAGCALRDEIVLRNAYAMFNDARLARTAERSTLLHEIGHHYDFQAPEWKRRVFKRIVGYADDIPWDDPYFMPRETFAVAYSICALPGRVEFTTRQSIGYAYAPSRRQHRRVCRLIRQPN